MQEIKTYKITVRLEPQQQEIVQIHMKQNGVNPSKALRSLLNELVMLREEKVEN